MAKDSDHRALNFETDNTGGLLSGLLADEDHLDRRSLWRIGAWGVGAVGAVVVAVMANQASLGQKREQIAAAELLRQAQQIQLAARETQNETRRLANAVDTLNSDRDRLYTRVTSLEQGLDSVTGSFIRQLPPNAATPAPAMLEPQAAATPAPVVGPVATAAPSSATNSSVAKDLPKIEPVQPSKPETAKSETVQTEKADAAKGEAAKSDLAKPEPARIEPARTDAAKPDPGKAEGAKSAAATPATPLVAAKSFMAPPDPSATRLTEPNKPAGPVIAVPIPEVVAATPPVSDEEADEATAPKVALQRTEFGVDLGSANSVNGLRAMWRGLLKSRSNAVLQPLRPVIMIREGTNGLGLRLHLVAGPLNDAGAAARICAVMTENQRTCETTVYDGQRLAFRSDEVAPTPAASAKPASPKRASPKRAATPVPAEEPKKPDTTSSISSSISSMFGRKSSQ